MVWTRCPDHCTCKHEIHQHTAVIHVGIRWEIQGCLLCGCEVYQLDCAAVEAWKIAMKEENARW